MAAVKRSPEDLQRLREHFGVMSTEAVQSWARSARERSRELREQAAERQRTIGVRSEVRPGWVAARARLLAERLQAAELQVMNLRKAQRSNRRIGMAIGILMARHGLTEEQAFTALRHVSSHRNIRLRDLAEEVVYTGVLRDDMDRRSR